MPTVRDEAVVLRTHKLGEADRIITLLSRNHGKVRAVAKGVRRTKSRFGSRLEPFMKVDFQYYTGANLGTITQVEIMEPFAPHISASLDNYLAGSAMLEVADQLVSTEGEPALGLYWLVVGALRTLATGRQATDLTLNAFLLRALTGAGWAPNLEGCVECGAAEAPTYFAVSQGGGVCAVCKPAGARPLSAASRELAQALIVGDWTTAGRAGTTTRQTVSDLVTDFTQFHLEREVRALRQQSRARSEYAYLP